MIKWVGTWQSIVRARAATEIKARNSSRGFVISNRSRAVIRISVALCRKREFPRSIEACIIVILGRVVFLALFRGRASFIQDCNYAKMKKGKTLRHILRSRDRHRAPSISFFEMLLSLFLINLFFCLLERQRTGRRIRWTSERVSTSHYFLIKSLIP